jgi:hypothetical protein
MKILKGSLVETRYDWPTVELNNGETRPLQPKSTRTYTENAVTYMSDKLGLHRISNPDSNDYAVSLHCKFSHYCDYGPGELMTCSIYTPKRGSVRMSYLQ